MHVIKSAAFVGMGALGLLFGNCIALTEERNGLFFLMDEERKKRHEADLYFVNGKKVSFSIKTPAEVVTPPDLIVIATKYSGLAQAIDLIKPLVTKDTVLISLLNGINSEIVMSDTFDRTQIINCVAIGMDAVRNGASLNYMNMGKWQIGAISAEQKPYLERLIDYLDRSRIPYEVCQDINWAMWNKFMINVGVNQTCMLYKTNYGGLQADGAKARADMIAAMREVMAVAKAEGITISEKDLEADLERFAQLDPEKMPSMRQDALAHRPTEVPLFAGTVTALGRKHGVAVPVNEKYEKLIREIEKSWGNN